MGGCACRENGAQTAICGQLRDRLRYALRRWRDENSGLVGEHGIGHPADVGRDARQTGRSGFEIDQTESLYPACGVGQSRQAEEIRSRVEIADRLVRLWAEETNIAGRLSGSLSQLVDIIGFAIRPDHEPCDPTAQIVRK